MAKYNHAVSIAFEVISDDPQGEDITPEMLKAGLIRRMENLDSCGDLEWLEACCPPFDTYEMDDELCPHS